MNKAKGKTITVRISEALDNRIAYLSEKCQISSGEVVRRSLNLYLNRLKRRDKLIERVAKTLGEKEADLLRAEYEKEETS